MSSCIPGMYCIRMKKVVSNQKWINGSWCMKHYWSVAGNLLILVPLGVLKRLFSNFHHPPCLPAKVKKQHKSNSKNKHYAHLKIKNLVHFWITYKFNLIFVFCCFCLIVFIFWGMLKVHNWNFNRGLRNNYNKLALLTSWLIVLICSIWQIAILLLLFFIYQ